MTSTPAPPRAYPLGYRAPLDGLRGIAALLVVLGHFGVLQMLGANNVGYAYVVDTFFVLSGFLITLLLIEGLNRKHDIGQFYWRRFLRFTPGLLALCAGFVVIALITNIPTRALIDELVSAISYTGNWTRAFGTGMPMYLGNSWSLAMEEQFYLLWPLLFLALGGLKKPGQVFAGAMALFIISTAWGLYLMPRAFDPLRVFNGLDTRGAGLALGCAMALGLSLPGGAALQKRIASFWPLGAAALIALVYFMDWTALGALGVNLASAILILAVWHLPESPLAKSLSFAPVVGLGKISYSLYLWNLPIMILLMHFGLNDVPVRAAIGVPLSLVLGYAGYKLVEKPSMRLRAKMSDKTSSRLGIYAAVFSAIAMAAGLIWFLGDAALQAVAPRPLVVAEYAPHTLKRGQTYNVQPKGHSAMWLRYNHTLPADAHIRINTRLAKADVQGKVVHVALPDDVRNTPGRYKILLESADNKPLAPAADLIINH